MQHICVWRKLQGHIAANRGQILGQECAFLVFQEIFFEFLARDPCRVLINSFQRSIVYEKFLGCLRTDARNAWNVVGSISHQSLHINEELRRETVLFQKALFIIE